MAEAGRLPGRPASAVAPQAVDGAPISDGVAPPGRAVPDPDREGAG